MEQIERTHEVPCPVCRSTPLQERTTARIIGTKLAVEVECLACARRFTASSDVSPVPGQIRKVLQLVETTPG